MYKGWQCRTCYNSSRGRIAISVALVDTEFAKGLESVLMSGMGRSHADLPVYQSEKLQLCALGTMMARRVPLAIIQLALPPSHLSQALRQIFGRY